MPVPQIWVGDDGRSPIVEFDGDIPRPVDCPDCPCEETAPCEFCDPPGPFRFAELTVPPGTFITDPAHPGATCDCDGWNGTYLLTPAPSDPNFPQACIFELEFPVPSGCENTDGMARWRVAIGSSTGMGVTLTATPSWIFTWAKTSGPNGDCQNVSVPFNFAGITTNFCAIAALPLGPVTVSMIP